MKLLSILALFFCINPLLAQDISFESFPEESVDDVFKLKWKAKIGLTNFRTNIEYFDGNIIVGSNGEFRGDTIDSADGVYVLKVKSGKLVKQLSPDHGKDGDVSGIAIGDDKIFFGDDNGYFYCYSNAFELLWKIDLHQGFTTAERCYLGNVAYTSDDIECAPGLADVNGDGKLDAIVLSEEGKAFAVDGETGKLLWTFKSPRDQKYLFIGAPALFDCNNDSVPDVLFGSRAKAGLCYGSTSGAFFIIDGKTGKQIDRHLLETGVSSATRLIKKQDNDNNPKNDIYAIFSGAYGVIYHYNIAEKSISEVIKTQGGGFYFSTPYFGNTGSYCVGGSWWGISDDGVFYWNEKEGISKKYMSGRVSATAVEADVLKKGFNQVIIPDEVGHLFILNAETGELIKRLLIPNKATEKWVIIANKWDREYYAALDKVNKMNLGAEASVFVEDVDGDGKLELLIACLDGFLYCYETKSKAESTIQSKFILGNGSGLEIIGKN